MFIEHEQVRELMTDYGKIDVLLQVETT